MGEEGDIIGKTVESLRSAGVESHQIPRGNIRHLRGCLWCLDLLNVENIDSVTISARKRVGEVESETVFGFEYALRGSISGIPPGRVILYTASYMEGLFRRKLSSVKWVVPGETQEPSGFKVYGELPRPGEVWEEGPHRVLVNQLNGDDTIMAVLKDLLQDIGDLTRFIIYSDRWNESIRMVCNEWLEEERALKIYTSSLYFEIAQGILGHIREVRRRFGGLTF